MDDLLIMKVLYLLMIGLLALAVGILPLYWKMFRKGLVWANLGTCFSGGIFLSVALVDLLPEATRRAHEVIGSTNNLANIMVLCGYSLILYIEKIGFASKSHHVIDAHNEVDDNVTSFKNQSRKTSYTDSISQEFLKNSFSPLLEKDELDAEKVFSQELISGLILAAALTMHNLLEGIAIGLQKTEAHFFNIALAVLLHHFFAAFALGINIKDLPKAQSLPLMISFVVSEPIGIAAGIGMSSMEMPLLDAIFLGLCTGTFLYISCSDIIVDEFSNPSNKYKKYFSYLLGIGLFTFLMEVVRI